jgi:anti-sigma factor RsiW
LTYFEQSVAKWRKGPLSKVERKIKEYPETPMTPCVAPDEVQDGDLLAFVEGEASPAVRAHVARCLFCAQEVAALQQVDSLFAAAFHRAECPESEWLLRYQTGLLSPAEKRRVKQHIKDCHDCQADLAELAGEPAPSMLNRVVTAVSQSLQEAGKQVIEAILLPSQPQPVLALRGGSQQHAVYQAGSYQLTLAKTPPIAAENLWQLEGQIVAGSSEANLAGQVFLLREDQSIASDVIDEFGYFALSNIRPGAYDLSIELNTSILLISAIAIP